MIFVQRPKMEEVVDDEPARKHFETRALEAASLIPGSSVITSRWESFRAGTFGNRDHGPKVCNAIVTYCRNKCVYCEAPAPATIDHFWPKAKYPAKMFDWDNLVAACRDCNSEKRTEFKLEENQKPLMIDPTSDEPLTHFRWNAITGKCEYQETDLRAVETARCIAMDRFVGERAAKLSRVRYFLAQCMRVKPIPNELREQLQNELAASRPYLCILRSYLLYPVHDADRVLIREAIHALPEILDWVKPWLHTPVGVKWPP